MVNVQPHSMLDIIGTKRDGGALDGSQIRWLVERVVTDEVPDYQLAAWLMAVVCRGMTDDETAALTDAMARSGDMLDLSGIPGLIVDKHSTGGVGDKTSLVVGPLAAATGLTVAKMSGRGLGHTGGTLDKLESIPGLSVDLDMDRFRTQAADVGLVIAGQTADLAPADKRLYALRDVTGTVPSMPLIAASIMSKKIAAGAASIVLDVKVGRGAFLADARAGRELALAMLSLGRRAGRGVAAQLSRMDQPLGLAIGNALEVREAAHALRGTGPSDLMTLSRALVALMHAVADPRRPAANVASAIDHALASGSAMAVLEAMVEAQGGDARALTDDALLPTAPTIQAVDAPRSGYVGSIDALEVGLATVELGAGRRVKGEPVDHAVGVVLHAKTGDRVRAGEPLALVHARTDTAAQTAMQRVSRAFSIDDEPAPSPPLLLEEIS